MARPIPFLPHQVPSPSSEGQTSSQWDRGSGGEEMALNTAVWVWVFGSVMCECGWVCEVWVWVFRQAYT